MRKIAAFLAATAATFAVTWLVLALPSDRWYAREADLLLDIELVLVWVGAISQTGFVLLWMTQPWWTTGWITRAIMGKSFGLALLLDISLVNYYVDPYPAAPMVALLVVGLVVLGSVTQLAALAWDTWASRTDDED